MSIGGRYTNEQRELTDGTTFTTLAGGTVLGPIQGVLASMKALNLPTITQNKDFTGKFSLSWEPSTNSTFYASYSRGIKGAGFNTGFSPGSTVEQNIDRKSVVSGKRVSVRVDPVGRRIIKKKNSTQTNTS